MSREECENESDLDRLDRKLITLVAEDRDKVAMERLYNAYRPRLGRFLRRYTQDLELIEEIFNDVMLKVWDKAHQYKGSAKVSTWVFTIACRACLRLLKKNKTRQQVQVMLEEQQKMEASELEQKLAQDEASNDRLDAAIAALSPKHRMVVELSYFQGCSTKEVGEILSCSQNTVKTRLHYSRKKIRDYLDVNQTCIL